MSVALFEEEKLFYAAVDVGAGVVPGVRWVVLCEGEEISDMDKDRGIEQTNGKE